MAHRGDNPTIPIPMCSFVSTFFTNQYSEPDYSYHLVTYKPAGLCDTRITPAVTNCYLFEPKSTAYFGRPLSKEFCDLTRGIHNFPHLPIPYIQSNHLHLICLKHYNVLPVLFEFTSNFPYVCSPVLPVYDMQNLSCRKPIFYISRKLFENLKSAYFCRTTAKAIIPIPSEEKLVIINNPFTSATWDIDHRIHGKIIKQSQLEGISGDSPGPQNPPRGPNPPRFQRLDHAGGGDTINPRAPNLGQQHPNVNYGGRRGGAYEASEGVSHPKYNSVDRLFNGDLPSNENLAKGTNIFPSYFHSSDLNELNHDIFSMAKDAMGIAFLHSLANVNHVTRINFGHLDFRQSDKNVNYKKGNVKIMIICKRDDLSKCVYYYYFMQNRSATFVTIFIQLPTMEFIRIKTLRFFKSKYTIKMKALYLKSFVERHVNPGLPKNPLSEIYGSTPNPVVAELLNDLRSTETSNTSAESPNNQNNTKLDVETHLRENNPVSRRIANFGEHIMSNFSGGAYQLFPLTSETESRPIKLSEDQTKRSLSKDAIDYYLSLTDQEHLIEKNVCHKTRELSADTKNAISRMFPKVVVIEKRTINDKSDEEEEFDEKQTNERNKFTHILSCGLDFVDKFVTLYSFIAEHCIIPLQNQILNLLMYRL